MFPLVGVLTASAAALAFSGEPIWDPSALAGHLENPILLIVLLVALMLATLTTNVAANVVSPSYDFSNAWPKRISFKTGGVITGILGILFMPWNFLADSSAYIFTWLGTYGGATGPIAGVLIADYWWIRRRHLRLADLYRRMDLPVRERLEPDRGRVAGGRCRHRHRRRLLHPEPRRDTVGPVPAGWRHSVPEALLRLQLAHRPRRRVPALRLLTMILRRGAAPVEPAMEAPTPA